MLCHDLLPMVYAMEGEVEVGSRESTIQPYGILKRSWLEDVLDASIMNLSHFCKSNKPLAGIPLKFTLL